jgi:hypothetical protein
MGELSYPTDKLTGLPYPVIPYEKFVQVDTNHAVFHSDNPLLQGLGGQAVRYSRVQEMDRAEHEILHDRYHAIACLPETADEQFEYCVWASLDDIPPYAVDLSRKNHWVTQLDNDQIDILRKRDIRVDSNQVLANFFAQYIQEQGLTHIDGYAVDQYLYTPFKMRKAPKGHWLLREAVEEAVSPLQPKYKKLRREGRIAVRPNVALEEIVMSKIGKNKREEFIKRKRLERSAVSDLGHISIETLETKLNEAERQESQAA